MASEIKENISSGEYHVVQKKGSSSIWKIFLEIKRDDVLIPDYVYCKSCKTVLKYNKTSTSNLNKHKCYVAHKENLVDNNSGSVLVSVSSETKHKFVQSCAKLSTKDLRPFTIVNGDGFKDVLQNILSIGARYGENVNLATLIPHPTTVARNIDAEMEVKKEWLKNVIKNDLTIEKRLAVSTDLWTDDFVKRSYICVVIHAIYNESIVECVLALKSMDNQRSTGQNILNKLNGIFNEFEIDIQNVVFVTDRGSNIKAALCNLERANCMDHIINNVLQGSFENMDSIKFIITSCRKLVKFFKIANLNAELEVTLKSDNSTRWNSVYMMMDSIKRNWPKINEILINRGETNRISSIEINIINDILLVLGEFEKACTKMQGATYPTIHYVITYSNHLKSCCTTKETDSTFIREFKQYLLNGLNSKYTPNVSKYHKIGFFLFPPANKLKIFSLEEQIHIKTICWREIKNNTNENTIRTHEQLQPTFDSCFEGIVDVSSDTIETIDDKIWSEINDYASKSWPFVMDNDILNWWSRHRCDYFHLYHMAMNVFNIPATSASAERTFSAAGFLINEKRNRLSPVRVNNILTTHTIEKLQGIIIKE